MRKYAKEMEIPPLHSKHRPAREIPIMATTAIATIQPTTNSNHYTHLTTPHLWILHIYNSQIEFSNQKKKIITISCQKESTQGILPLPSCEGLPHQTCPPQTACSPRRPPRSQTSTAQFNGPGHVQSRISEKSLDEILILRRCLYIIIAFAYSQ